jgi:hypothetical protein
MKQANDTDVVNVSPVEVSRVYFYRVDLYLDMVHDSRTESTRESGTETRRFPIHAPLNDSAVR